MLLRALALYFLVSISAGKEIGLLGYNQEYDPRFQKGKRSDHVLNRNGKFLFQVPFAASSFVPIDLNMTPISNYKNSVLPDTATREELAAERSPILSKFPFSLGQMPNFHKKITLTNPPNPSPPKPSPEWNFKLKFPDFMFPFHNIHKKKFHPDEEDEATTECAAFGGKIVLGECYRLFSKSLSYSDARMDCHKRGADLWTPDLRNPFLLHFLALAIPEVGMAPSEELWIGALHINGRVITADGEDISDAVLLLPNDGDDAPGGECSSIEFEKGQIYYDPENCEDEEFYLCEYRLTQRMGIHKVFG